MDESPVSSVASKAVPLWRRVWFPVACALLVLGAVAFRVRLVDEYHVPAVDGMQYFALSQELGRANRLAFGPREAPSYSRMPGYPLFLAHVAVRKSPVDLQTHLVRATRANALLDVGTALLLFLILHRWGRGAAVAGLLAAVACPLLFCLASHALTETLATFLATLELYLALRARDSRPLLHAVLAGGVAGAAQLVRADAVTMAPAVILVLLSVDGGWKRRALLVGACGLAAGLVFAPWPARNLAQFGKPYLAAWQWRTAFGGRPLPTGPIEWARTWTKMTRSESFLDGDFAFERPIDLRHGVLPAMYDDEAERRRVVAALERYNRERFSPAVDEEFRQLARDRAARSPLRTRVWLPLRRLPALFATVGGDELSMRSKLIGLPRFRPWFAVWDGIVYGLGLLALLALAWRPWREREGRMVAVLLLAIAVRAVLLTLTVPMALSQRHLVEVYPVILLLAVLGAVAAARLIGGLRRATKAA